MSSSVATYTNATSSAMGRNSTGVRTLRPILQLKVAAPFAKICIVRGILTLSPDKVYSSSMFFRSP